MDDQAADFEEPRTNWELCEIFQAICGPINPSQIVDVPVFSIFDQQESKGDTRIMKYFLDTEFSERGPRHPIELISIGIVAEDGREFYAHSADYDVSACNEWVTKNVLPHLQSEPRMSLQTIAESLKWFIGDDKPEFWGYYADYDWVVFAQMFGTMVDLPKGWPMYCRDLKQWCDQIGNPKLPAQESTEHNALNDAHWNRIVHAFLEGRSATEFTEPAQQYCTRTRNHDGPCNGLHRGDCPVPKDGKWRVLTPSGVIADGAWDRLEDIPEKIPDRFGWYFETADAEKICI